MSRSRKKTPGWCDRHPWNKNYANRVVRRYKGGIPLKGNRYKRLFESYNICDFKHLCYTERAVRYWTEDRIYPIARWKLFKK